MSDDTVDSWVYWQCGMRDPSIDSSAESAIPVLGHRHRDADADNDVICESG